MKRYVIVYLLGYLITFGHAYRTSLEWHPVEIRVVTASLISLAWPFYWSVDAWENL